MEPTGAILVLLESWFPALWFNVLGNGIRIKAATSSTVCFSEEREQSSRDADSSKRTLVIVIIHLYNIISSTLEAAPQAFKVWAICLSVVPQLS